MQYRRLGRTGFDVSVIGFGGAAVSGQGGGYGFGSISEAESIRLCHAVLDAGINLFDTAPAYGLGESERRIGKALRDRRERAVIVSKCGIVWDDRGNLTIDNHPDTVRRMLDQSLRDLAVEVIDLYLVHWPDAQVDIRETVAALVDAQRAGKIRFIGLSNTYPEDLARAQEVADVAVLQSALHLFQRWSASHLLPLVRAHDLGFMGYGTLDKGILTGRVTSERQFEQSDVRSWAPWWRDVDHGPKYRAMGRILPLLEAAGHSGLELALGVVLRYAELSTALVGVKSLAQLDTAVAALDHLPPAGLIAQAVSIAEEEGAVGS